MNREELLDFLADEGFRPEPPDEDGNIVFKYQGSTLIINVDDDDPDYVRLAMLATLERESFERQLAAANDVAAQIKVGKCHVSLEDDCTLVCFAVEAFGTMALFKDVYERYLAIVTGMASTFGELLRERLAADGGDDDVAAATARRQ